MKKLTLILLVLTFSVQLMAAPMPNALKGYIRLFKPGMTKQQVQKIIKGWGLVDVSRRYRSSGSTLEKRVFRKIVRPASIHDSLIYKFVNVFNQRCLFIISINQMEELNFFCFMILGNRANKQIFHYFERNVTRNLGSKPSAYNPNDNPSGSYYARWQNDKTRIDLENHTSGKLLCMFIRSKK